MRIRQRVRDEDARRDVFVELKRMHVCVEAAAGQRGPPPLLPQGFFFFFFSFLLAIARRAPRCRARVTDTQTRSRCTRAVAGELQVAVGSRAHSRLNNIKHHRRRWLLMIKWYNALRAHVCPQRAVPS